MGGMTGSDGYVLGRAASEIERLRLQAEIYASHSEHLLVLAGIRPGLRVLDIGCGAGDLTMIAARLVGPGGAVIGVDMDADVLELARVRAREAGLANVSFQQATVPDLIPAEPVDALIGRLILVHLADSAGTVRALSRLVRPGGVVTFQDLSPKHSGSEPETPLVAQAYRWVVDSLRSRGGDPATGQRLYRVLRAAGFADIGVAAEIPAGTADSAVPRFVAGTVRSLLPLIEATGVATREEVGIDTLAERISAELAQVDAVLWPPELIGGWARVR